MEKTTTTSTKGLSSPHIRKGMSFGDNKTSCRSIRETITLPSGSWVGLEGKGLVRVNSTLYNLKYYELVPSDTVQREVIRKALRQITPKTTTTPHTSKSIVTQTVPNINPKHLVSTELNQIELIGKLVKKVSSWQDKKEKATKEKNEDKFILLGRQLKKDRLLIEQYLKTLVQDSCFSIKDNFIHYNGEFASCKRLLPEGGI